jgi:chromosome partitioning protein
MIITICCEKGGVGKSSLAQALSVYLKLKNKDILLVDADPQRTSSEWAEERGEQSSLIIPCIEKTGNISGALQELKHKYKIIVIDCGGADSRAMRSSLSVSNIALLPFRPKRRDLRTALKMADIIDTVKALNPQMIVRSVLTQAPTLPSQLKRIESARELLKSLELNPLMYFSRNLNCWDDAEENGLSVLEYSEDKKGADDAVGIFNELFEGVTI